MLETELSGSDDTCSYYTVSQKDVIETSLPTWYHKFASATIKTKILEVPPNVLEYLRSESMRLPLNTESSSFSFQDCRHSSNESLDELEDHNSHSRSHSQFNEDPNNVVENQAEIRNRINLNGINGNYFACEDDETSSDESGGEVDTNIGVGSTNPTTRQSSSSATSVVFEKFETFDGQIKRAIDNLDGSAFPKLNWKSPKDAMWIAFNRSLRSYLPGDIYLTLKSSTNVYNVLHEPFKDSFNYDGIPCSYHLCLRQWTDIDPATEFRCFVHENRLICISQRETSGGYEKIPAQRDSIIQDIYDFFRNKIYGKFPLDNYVFDVARRKPGSVILVDFNVFGLATDPLLFTYREIKMVADEMDSRLKEKDSEFFLQDASVYGDPHFRFIGEHGSVHPITSRKLT